MIHFSIPNPNIDLIPSNATNIKIQPVKITTTSNPTIWGNNDIFINWAKAARWATYTANDFNAQMEWMLRWFTTYPSSSSVTLTTTVEYDIP